MDFLEGISQTVAAALAEDLGDGDITAQLVDAEETAAAQVLTREPCVVCGRPWVDEVFRQVDPDISITWLVTEGEQVPGDTVLFRLTGRARSLLTAERSALNFLQTLSATATRTADFVSLIDHTDTKLLDTRKTIPGLRMAQKYAVRTGGGENHRIGLFDAFLIKENHIAAAGSITKAIMSARALYPERRLEIEVEDLSEYREALQGAPDWIMLDNFSLDDLAAAVAGKNDAVRLEASGGIEDANDLRRIAETGVDYISVGALTKHVQATDLSMRFVDDKTAGETT